MSHTRSHSLDTCSAHQRTCPTSRLTSRSRSLTPSLDCRVAHSRSSNIHRASSHSGFSAPPRTTHTAANNPQEHRAIGTPMAEELPPPRTHCHAILAARAPSCLPRPLLSGAPPAHLLPRPNPRSPQPSPCTLAQHTRVLIHNRRLHSSATAAPLTQSQRLSKR